MLMNVPMATTIAIPPQIVTIQWDHSTVLVTMGILETASPVQVNDE